VGLWGQSQLRIPTIPTRYDNVDKFWIARNSWGPGENAQDAEQPAGGQ
jgi:hypothetical protein